MMSATRNKLDLQATQQILLSPIKQGTMHLNTLAILQRQRENYVENTLAILHTYGSQATSLYRGDGVVAAGALHTCHLESMPYTPAADGYRGPLVTQP